MNFERFANIRESEAKGAFLFFSLFPNMTAKKASKERND